MYNVDGDHKLRMYVNLITCKTTIQNTVSTINISATTEGFCIT